VAKKNKGPVQKQNASVYTMMLIFSFLALVLACVMLYLELERYKFDINADEYNRSSVRRPAVTSTFLG